MWDKQGCFSHVFFISITYVLINAEAGRSGRRKEYVMQYEKAMQLKAAWGNKSCSHPSFQKEYYLCSQTGDYVCVQCGESFTLQEKEEIEKYRDENE